MAATRDVVCLVNICPEKWPPRHRTYFGSLEIQSPAPGEPYAVTPVRGGRGVIDLGDKRTMEYTISAREIAEDLARELNGDSGEGSFHGVFVAAGAAPTAAELAGARQLGLEKPWLYDPKPLAECPVCAEKIKPGVAVCRGCGAILDRARAAQFGLVAAEEEKKATEPPRAPKGK